MAKKKKTSSVAAKSALKQVLEAGGRIIFDEHPDRKHVNRTALRKLEKRVEREAAPEELDELPLKGDYQKLSRVFTRHAAPDDGEYPRVSASYKAVHVAFNKEATGEDVELFIPVKGMLSHGAVSSIEGKTGLKLTPQN